MREIYFSHIDENNTVETLKLPFIRDDIEVIDDLNIEDFKNSKGKVLSIVGERGNRFLSISSFFPSQRYNWMKSEDNLAPQCIDFFERNRKNVLRVVYVDGFETICNMLCIITSFSKRLKTNKDYDYTLSIREYIEPETLG